MQAEMWSEFVVQQTVSNKAVWAMITLCEKKDPYTAEHQLRVAQLAYVVSKEMGLSEWQSGGLCVMGAVHDIGKITLPGEILNKSGRLSAEEFSVIKSHPRVGYEVLRNLEFDWPVAEVVLYHHERLDGSGYPSGLRGDDIMIEARILAVVDVFESMISHRPYRPARTVGEALEEIVEHDGILYDRQVVDALYRVIKKFPLAGYV